MDIVDRGSGPPLVLIPGLQGRWEYLRPAVDALSSCFRVLTFSLDADDLDGYAEQVGSALSEKGIERATICGVSFGGLIAVTYAAERRQKASRLVLVSTPSPNWQPDERARRYANAPRSTAVSFVAGAPGRLYREISAALPEHRQRIRALAGYVGSILQHPTTPKRMADRGSRLRGAIGSAVRPSLSRGSSMRRCRNTVPRRICSELWVRAPPTPHGGRSGSTFSSR